MFVLFAGLELKMQSGFFLFMQIDQLIPQETQQATMIKISLTENRD